MTRTLYVGNLPWSTDADELNSFFGNYGGVVNSRIIVERETGRSRGFGFVEVNDEDAEKIIEALNGADFQGRILTVNEAKPRQ
ncbi:MAG: RNA-binding protein [Thermacetogeniaceae bacterium]